MQEFNFDNLDIKFDIGHTRFSVLYLRSSSLSRVPMHYHTAYEIHYVLSDNETVFIDETKFDLHSGMIYVTGPNVWHQQSSRDEHAFLSYTICIDIDTDTKPGSGEAYTNDDLKYICEIFSSTSFWIGSDSHHCKELIEKIANEINNQKVGYYAVIQNCLKELIINIVRSYLKDVPTAWFPKFTPELKDISDMRKHLFDMALIWSQPPLSELADIIGLSARQTERLFVKYYGMTYAKKKLELNLRGAAHLLTTTDMLVADICNETHFNNIEYFYRMFKLFYGKTPTEFRNDPNAKLFDGDIKNTKTSHLK